MNFDSIFFVSCFLPVVLALYWLMPGIKAKNGLLLVVSLVFYSFGSLSGLLLLLGCCLVNYLFGLWLCRGARVKPAVVIGVCLNVAFLFVYKYLNYLLTQVMGLSEADPGLVIPIGISYFTFKNISYLVDIYRDKKQAAKSFSDFVLYVTFFPQIVMGPITRFRDFAPQLEQRQISMDNTVAGLRRFAVGLGKKLILAGTIGGMVDSIFGLGQEVLDARLAWFGAIGYCLQLFFDFSGYIDMVIGLGRVFGFQTTENFDYPYIATTIGEFWRRWHISLSSWFKDYVYIPLGGNRKGKLRTGINKAIVFILCGIWHGANWTFLLWGVWHGLFSMLESTNAIPAKRLQKTKLLGRVYTLLIVCIGFVMFRATSVGQGLVMLGAMFTDFAFTPAGTAALHTIVTWEAVVMLGVGIVLSTPVIPKLRTAEKLRGIWEPVSCGATLALLVLCIMKLAAGDFAPSIYAGF